MQGWKASTPTVDIKNDGGMGPIMQRQIWHDERKDLPHFDGEAYSTVSFECRGFPIPDKQVKDCVNSLLSWAVFGFYSPITSENEG